MRAKRAFLVLLSLPPAPNWSLQPPALQLGG